MFQEARTRNCDAITNALSFNNEPIEESQNISESGEAVDIDEADDEAEEETMSLSMWVKCNRRENTPCGYTNSKSTSKPLILKISGWQGAEGIFEKKENPQTAILSHLWDCKMVTRTGIESQNRRFLASCDCVILPILRNFEAIYGKRFFLFFSAFS